MNPSAPQPSVSDRLGRWPIARLTGLSGLLMVAAIVINGPLSTSVEKYPSFWTSSAGADLGEFLQNPDRTERAVVFFALSNLIFIFAIPFFAGLRVLVRDADPSGFLRGVVGIAVPLFLAGGLASETFSRGMPAVMESVPAYDLDPNSALMVQGLQYVALVQGQVALGVAIIALSFASWRSGALPKWMWWVGAAAGTIDLVRPFAVTSPPLLIATFVPTFVWIAVTSVLLIRNPARSR